MGNFWKRFTRHPYRYWIYSPLIFAAILLLDIAATGDNLEKFALVLGLELLVLAVVSWGIFLYKRIQDDHEELG